MVSAHNEQATAATRRNWCRADPRAYIRIAAVLRERTTAGDLAPGQAMPSITRLCADHGVARQTAAHALHVLQDAGLVYRVLGLGYHVRNAILSQPVLSFPGHAEDRADKGRCAGRRHEPGMPRCPPAQQREVPGAVIRTV